MQYIGNMFDRLTTKDVIHALVHNDVTRGINALGTIASYYIFPEAKGAQIAVRGAEVVAPAARVAASGAAKEIALGLDPYYKKLAEATGALPWRKWVGQIVNQPGSPRFGRLFNQAAKNATHIHFALDGIVDVQAVVRKGSQGFIDQNYTNAELHSVMTNPTLRAKTTFYRGGKAVTP